MTLKSNLTQAQRKILQELKEDESIIICPADKGKAVVIEDRDTYLAIAFKDSRSNTQGRL